MRNANGNDSTPTMGEVLQDARYRRSVSLDEAEYSTHVRKKYLVALEEDDYSQLPPPVYARGFLEIYAEYLGLDPQYALKLFQPPARTASSAPLRPVNGIDDGFSLPLRAIVVTALAALGIAAVFYLYMQYLEFASNTNEVVTSRPTPAATATALIVAVVLPTPAATAVPTPSPTPVRTVEVAVQITERSWLRVVADGQSTALFEGEMQAGETRTWKARDRIDMRVGNAGGVEVTVNGLRQGKLGASGEVKNVTWGRQ